MRLKLVAAPKTDFKDQLAREICRDHAFLLTVAQYLDKHLHRFKKLINRAKDAEEPNEDSSEELANEYGAAWDALKDAIINTIKDDEDGVELAKELLKLRSK